MYKNLLNDTIKFIEENKTNGFSIMFSGGKDSVVLYHIIKTYFKSMPVELLCTCTGMQYDTWYTFMQVYYPETKYHPSLSVFDIMKKFNRLPSATDRICCNYIISLSTDSDISNYETICQGKKRNDRKCRKYAYIKKSGYLGRKKIIQPLLDWSNEDVLDYIKDNDLKYYKDSPNCSICFLKNISYEKKIERLKNNPIMAKKFYETVHYIYTNNIDIQNQYETEEKYINWFLNQKRRIVNQ